MGQQHAGGSWTGTRESTLKRARGHTCWIPGHCHVRHFLPESPARESIGLCWVTRAVEKGVMQPEDPLDVTDVNPPLTAVEFDTSAVVGELDTLVSLCRNHTGITKQNRAQHQWSTAQVTNHDISIDIKFNPGAPIDLVTLAKLASIAPASDARTRLRVQGLARFKFHSPVLHERGRDMYD